MPPITRRNALRAGVVSLAALAGCSSDSGSGSGSQNPRLDSVRVSNSLSQSVSLDLQLELDGEVVFWSDVGIEGTDGEDAGQSVHGATFEPPAFPQQRGEWRVRARVRDTNRMYSTLFNSETTAESCLALGVAVQEDDVEISYVATHECGDVTTTTQS
ncbi:hypothetical protein HALDL1_12420 [Halobacterium sp. DL1]|jgi:hypothetical protein|nr:hypothetical protein HALDL1_12420 [Halobacterium sp. DL1]